MEVNSRARRWGVIALVFGAVALAPAPAQASFSGVADCRDAGGGEIPIYDMSVRNMGCGTAKRTIRSGSFTRRGYRVRGWNCKKISSYYDGATYRCTAGRRAFRWTSGG